LLSIFFAFTFILSSAFRATLFPPAVISARHPAAFRAAVACADARVRDADRQDAAADAAFSAWRRQPRFRCCCHSPRHAAARLVLSAEARAAIDAGFSSFRPDFIRFLRQLFSVPSLPLEFQFYDPFSRVFLVAFFFFFFLRFRCTGPVLFRFRYRLSFFSFRGDAQPLSLLIRCLYARFAHFTPFESFAEHCRARLIFAASHAVRRDDT